MGMPAGRPGDPGLSGQPLPRKYLLYLSTPCAPPRAVLGPAGPPRRQMQGQLNFFWRLGRLPRVSHAGSRGAAMSPGRCPGRTPDRPTKLTTRWHPAPGLHFTHGSRRPARRASARHRPAAPGGTDSDAARRPPEPESGPPS